MKVNMKRALAVSTLAIVGLSTTGSAMANPGFGHHGGPFRMVMLDMLSGIDTNADGALSQEEINAAISSRYTRFDANKDGQLSLEEFQALWADLTRPIAVRAFQFLDPNGDAFVARSEVDQRFSSLVTRLDQNHDGKLSHEDRRHGGHWWRGWRGRGPHDQSE
jgi:Ca2+-binding EF-hand superfamily protein